MACDFSVNFQSEGRLSKLKALMREVILGLMRTLTLEIDFIITCDILYLACSFLKIFQDLCFSLLGPIFRQLSKKISWEKSIF